MEEKIKSIIGLYLKLSQEQIIASTVIDRSALVSSILLHRMYAHLAKEGFFVENYQEIKTFGGLLQKTNMQSDTSLNTVITSPLVAGNLNDNEVFLKSLIGIDLEEIKLMPIANDFREDEFYSMNFSPSEIAYCILQANPYASFAGLFAAKESIVKADNSFINTLFNKINIDHLPGGKPIHPQFQISISHTPSLAIAIAIKYLPPPNSSSPYAINQSSGSQQNQGSLIYLLCFLSLFLSALAILLLFFKK